VTAAEEVFGPYYESARLYVDILATRGIAWGLIGPREGDRLWERHVLNSVALADLLPEGSTVADVGSGAGLPGLPLAILRPDLRVDLVEPLLRRATFLTQAVNELGMTDRVRVVRARAEDHEGRYDAVVSRALAPLDRLVGWCEPLRSPDGVILALKGRSAAEELGRARAVLARHRLTGEVLTVRAHPTVEPTTVVRLGRSGRASS
jgi:16S rRNA (guanine527-N7)-methyltransferase